MSNRDNETMAAEAAEWFARVRSGQMSARDTADLETRLGADAELRQAYEALSGLWTQLDVIRADPAILSMRESARRGTVWRRLGRLAPALAAAGLVVAAIGGMFVAGERLQAPQAPPAVAEQYVAYSTKVGQISTVALADGSTVVLDTDTALRFSESEGRRSAELLRGRALFKVAKNPAAPFTVTAQGRTVTALGTEFDVYVKDRTLEVSLFEGRVRVEQAQPDNTARRAPTVELTPGYKVVASARRWAVTAAPETASWTAGRLVFDEARVADIAAELNRYSSRQIAVVDPGVGEKRMSAVLGAGDERAFLSAVKVMHLADVRWSGGRYELTAP